MICHQYKIREQTLQSDREALGLSETNNFTVTDFDFYYVAKEDKQQCQEIAQFILKYEWLGKMGMYPTHRFIARLKSPINGQNPIGGVIVVDMPNSFSTTLLGANLGQIERLLSRGACASWTPKNLGSAIVMFAIRWMVKHTHYRLFTAYSDPEAGELGTIYQACNFTYLGKDYGAKELFFDPCRPDRNWFSDRRFRSKEFYGYYAREFGIEYTRGQQLTPELKQRFKECAKIVRDRCVIRYPFPKHKYCYILGKDKRETKQLRDTFARLNPSKIALPYPKVRGK